MIFVFGIGAMFFMVLQGFFAASEIAFISSNPLILRYRDEKGDRRAGKVYAILQSPEKFLATTLTGTNFSLVMSSTLITFVLIELRVENSNLWTTCLFTPMVVVFAELVPKNVGRYFREEFACLVVGSMEFFEMLFSRVTGSIEVVSRLVVRIFVGRVRRRSLFVAKEELKSLVREIASQGGIDAGEKEAIEEAFEFRDNKVKHVCVRINDVVSADYRDSRQKIQEIAVQKGFTRYPVMRDSDVAGYINIFDLFYHPEKDWHEFIRPVMRVGVNQSLLEVLTRMKARKQNLALVIKGRKVYGVIALQDLIHEILNSIIKI